MHHLHLNMDMLVIINRIMDIMLSRENCLRFNSTICAELFI